MITDGIDRFGGVGPANPYVDTAIEQAQKAGVLVHSIFATGVGHFGRMRWPITWGQNYLSEIATETGGQAYFLGYETPVSFAPYLEDLSRRLNHQYLLGFLAKPEKNPACKGCGFAPRFQMWNWSWRPKCMSRLDRNARICDERRWP